jgi:hypothetical protein
MATLSDKPRGRPFVKGKSGNIKGRPQGARNRTTLAAEALLDGEAEALTRKAVELALNGDINALRLCLDRLIPPRREQPLDVDVRKLESLHDAQDAVADIVAGVAAGDITLSAAAELGKLIELYIRTCEAADRARQREAVAAVTTLDPSRLTPAQFATMFDLTKFTDEQLIAVIQYNEELLRNQTMASVGDGLVADDHALDSGDGAIGMGGPHEGFGVEEAVVDGGLEVGTRRV